MNLDWESIFIPSVPVLEIIIRGSAMYLALFALLRVVIKREAGTLGMTDLLVVVLIADAAQNGMAGDYRAIPDGVLLVATIIFWSQALNWLGYRFPWFQRLVHPPPLLLVKNGRMIRQNMRRELITPDELMAQLREQGIDDLAEVKNAYMEGNGQISVVTADRSQHEAPERKAT